MLGGSDRRRSVELEAPPSEKTPAAADPGRHAMPSVPTNVALHGAAAEVTAAGNENATLSSLVVDGVLLDVHPRPVSGETESAGISSPSREVKLA
eukprot:SAG22_NODE_2491_length_2514_cov_1.004969_3_plen_95_part_00